MPLPTAVFLASSTVVVAIPLLANYAGGDPQAMKDVTEPIAQEAAKTAAKVAIGLMEDERMRLWVLVGAFCGAWMSVLAFRPLTWREALAKWIVSFLASLIFIPFGIEAMGLAGNTSAVLAISGLAALIGWTLVQKITPALEAIAETALFRWIRSKLGMPVQYDTKPARKRSR